MFPEVVKLKELALSAFSPMWMFSDKDVALRSLN